MDTSAIGSDQAAGGNAAPKAWLFYAGKDDAAAGWATDIRPGEIFFWRHDSTAYTKQLKIGDSVAVMIGVGPAHSRKVGGHIIATGVLAADTSLRFIDTKQKARRWPVLCVDAFQKRPITREEVEASTGPLIKGQGAVHPLTSKTLSVLNSQLSDSRASHQLPLLANTANQLFRASEPINSALSRNPHIQPPNDLNDRPWPPTISIA